MRASGYSDPSFAAIASLAHVLAGLVFPPNRQPSAEAGMRRAMAALRISDPAALLRAAERPGHERDIILAELTVGESYFFRDEAQLRILTSQILPSHMQKAAELRPLRIWSAGCASGEEAYTLAIMLREAGWPAGASILGTDVALPRLRAARRGRYTRWALRGVSEARVDKWFNRSGSAFDLDPSVRDAAEFRALNLVHDEYQSGEARFDLVLCRNVMIYFDLDTVASIATKLLDALAEDGWLVLGASDPPLAHLVECEAVMTPNGLAYRRPGRAAVPQRIQLDVPPIARWKPALMAPPVAPVDTPPRARATQVQAYVDAPRTQADDTIASAYARADYATVELLTTVALQTADSTALWIPYIRAVANQGRLEEAGELCARALDTHALDAELHYLHATLLAQAGWGADAARAARRSIYLDRTFVMSHLLLGDTLAGMGERKAARMAFENAVVLLGDGASPMRGADGVPAGRLKQIAMIRLQSLGDSA